jgi:hypothetical protein
MQVITYIKELTYNIVQEFGSPKLNYMQILQYTEKNDIKLNNIAYHENANTETYQCCHIVM